MSKTEFLIFISKTALLVGFSISVSASIKFPVCQAHTLGIIFHASHTLSQQILALLLRKYTQYVFNLFLPLLLLPPVSNHHYLLPEIWQVSFAGLFLQSFSFIACYQRWKMSFTVFSSIFSFFNLYCIFFALSLSPLIPPYLWQSPYCCLCPWVLFLFSSIPPPPIQLPHPAVICSPMSLTHFPC